MSSLQQFGCEICGQVTSSPSHWFVIRCSDTELTVLKAHCAARRHEHWRERLDDAVEKVVAGPERKSRRMTPEDRRRVAYHETGHALVAAYSKHADVVHKISIVPRGRAALGYTLQLPESQRDACATTRVNGLWPRT